jgi:hypothetical protein
LPNPQGHWGFGIDINFWGAGGTRKNKPALSNGKSRGAGMLFVADKVRNKNSKHEILNSKQIQMTKRKIF